MFPRLVLFASFTAALVWTDPVGARPPRGLLRPTRQPVAVETTSAPAAQEATKQVLNPVADLVNPIPTWSNLDIDPLVFHFPIKEELVYLQNIPYFTEFVGHVVKRNETITLMKNYPLYEDNPRNGIWSSRLPYNPMERINFKVKKNFEVRHGIVTASLNWKTKKTEWKVTWFYFKDAVQQKDGRFAWDLLNGYTELLSGEQMRQVGLQELIEWGKNPFKNR